MTALAGDEKNWRTCYAYYTCGTPMASEAGADALKGKRDAAKAKALLKDAGYNGERIVMMTPTDQPNANPQPQAVPHDLPQPATSDHLHPLNSRTLTNRPP